MATVYKIGVALHMASNHAQVLGALSNNLLGINTQVKQLTGQFKGLKLAITGALGVYAGDKIIRAMGVMVEHGSKIVHQQEMMRIAGVSNQGIAEATAKAYQTSAKVQTTTIAENLKHLNELRYAFGHMDVAENYLNRISKANSILNSVKGGGQDQVWDLVKSLEQKGITANPTEFMRYVDIMTKAVESSGGRVTPRQFFQAFQYGRTAMLGWDETFVGQYLPRLIQSMAGSGSGGRMGPGNALMSAFAKIVQGQMPKVAASTFRQFGLADGVRHIPGSSQSETLIHGRGLFQKNPYEWVQSVLMPSLAAHGIKSQQQIIETISRMFPVRTASQIISEMALQGRYREGLNSPFEKDAHLARIALGTLRSFQDLMSRDPTTVMAAFHAQWESLLEALGYATVKPAMFGMQAITEAVTSLTKIGYANPGLFKDLAWGMGALGAFLIGGGAAAILAALGPAGWLVGGLAALAVGIAALHVPIEHLLGLMGSTHDAAKAATGKPPKPSTWWHYLFASPLGPMGTAGQDWNYRGGGYSLPPTDWSKMPWERWGLSSPRPKEPFFQLPTWLGGSWEPPAGYSVWGSKPKAIDDTNKKFDELNKNLDNTNWLLRLWNKLSYEAPGGGGLPGLTRASYVTSAGAGGGSWSDIGKGGGISPSRAASSAIHIPGAFGAAPAGHIGRLSHSKAAGAHRLMRDLIGRGWSKEAAAVAAGNVAAESGFNTGSVGDGGTSFGLAQWHLDRARNLMGAAKGAGVDWHNWDFQVGFLDKEWRQRYGDASIKSHDLNRLKWLGKKYEGYSTNSFGYRNGLTDRFLHQYGDTDADRGSPAIPPVPRTEHHTPLTLKMDGRTVARGVIRHATDMANGPARGPATYDHTATRPIAI